MSNMYEMRVKVMNAPLLNLMRMKGMNTAADLSRATGIAQATIGNILNLRVAAFNRSGEVLKPVAKMAEYFNVLPECLFPEDNVYISLEKNEFRRQLSGDELARLSGSTADPLELVSNKQQSEMLTIENMTDTLNERERDIIKQRFEDGKTFAEIAKTYDLSNHRISQIVDKATRKLKSIARSKNPLWAQFDND